MEEKKLYNAVRKIITLADGRQIEIETGKLAKQADGSVVVKMGDTMLLGTVVAAKDAKPDTDFMPLQAAPRGVSVWANAAPTRARCSSPA